MQETCAACGLSFSLTSKDLAFYEKVSPVFSGQKIAMPHPMLCPTCRVQRRMAWRNDRSFYHRKCSLTGKQFISIYPESTPFPVYQPSGWYSDKWDPMQYGQDFDFNRSFFNQWKELMLKVPRLGVDIVNCENSDYCNYCGDDKNCYLDIAGEANENCYFDLFTKYSRNCLDCTFAYRSELCYECISCYSCYACRWSQYLEDCAECDFCFDCKGCKNCLLSTNLRSKQYTIFNEPHTKAEYEAKLKELQLSSASSVQHVKELWQKERIAKGIYRDMYNLSCENCTGNDLKNCKNCHVCFNATNCEDCQYLYDVLDATDCQDLSYSLYKPEVAYELISTLNMRFSAFNMASHYCANVFYCDLTNNSKNLFGCIGLNHGEYCILNKEYPKDEYEELVLKIIEHMKHTGEFGEFLPASLSPFGYNETVAQEYLPLTKEEACNNGFNWRDETKEQEQYLGPPFEIPDSIADVGDDICKQVLLCEVSKRPYKIIPQELAFYRQLHVPIPRRSPMQRHEDRNALRNPRKLWDCRCAKCHKPITTSYSPDRPEVVFCESCYLAAIH